MGRSQKYERDTETNIGITHMSEASEVLGQHMPYRIS